MEGTQGVWVNTSALRVVTFSAVSEQTFCTRYKVVIHPYAL